MEDPSSYILSAYSFINCISPDKLLDVGDYRKNGNPIPSFDETLLIELCLEAEQTFSKESNVLELNGDFTIVGDIHGSFHDLLRILNFIDDDKKVLFLGDYVDRGNFSIECITILYALKISDPMKYYLIRGNHEFDSVCSRYGFKDEILNYHNPKKNSIHAVKKFPSLTMKHSMEFSEKVDDDHFLIDVNCYKYSEELYKAFVRSFSYLPIAAILNSSTFCIHGGLSPKFEHVDQLNSLICRPINGLEDSQLLSDLVWSDPSKMSNYMFDENPRGRGYIFNRESVCHFLKKNSLKRIIRAHQCVQAGIQQNFEGKCITVFSASSYDLKIENSSSILQLFQKDDNITYHTFQPIDRLEKCDAIYYKVQSRSFQQSHVYFSLLHPRLISNVNYRNPLNMNIRQIRMHKSQNYIYSNANNRSLKFTTNKRKPFVTVHAIESLTCCNSYNSEYDDNNGDNSNS